MVASLSSLVLLALTAWVAPAAGADPQDPERPVLPSRGEVLQAESDVQDAAGRVAEIQAALALANAELEAAAVSAAQAYEAYNGARWRADQAAAELREATQDARRAERALSRQRERLAGFVATSYQEAGSLSALDAVLGADGPEGVMDELLAFEGASASLDAELQGFAATDDLADVFRAEAAEARQEKLRLLDEAEAARDAATAAAEAAQSVADTVAAQKAELVAELARLEGISVGLAEQRQSALEEIERQRAAEAAAEAARAAAEEAAEEAALVAARQQEEAEQDQQEQEQAPVPAADGPEPPTTPTAPAPAPAPPVDPTPPAPAGGASAAIAFAEAQLGEPYVWGAAGPDAWDCSGLTMAAWQAGGVSLPHYSVAQYDAATPIGVGELRPGDLLFWGTTSSPGSIFHVALYAGDGMMVHAPRTGRPVVVDSMYYWVPPTFFGRV